MADFVESSSLECGREHDQEWDLIIIGAGPAGLFCAINCRQKDKRILILEKKRLPGRKLLISGSGHCNITHEGDISSFLDHYGDSGRFLRPALLGFTNSDLISFFEGLGLAMIREETGKIFPGSLRSGDVLDILLQECNTGNIHLHCGQSVESIARHPDGFRVVSRGRAYRSPLLVIATGGCSYPATGSAGDGYRFARDLGHSIAEIGRALTPVYIKDYPFPDLAGISFSGLDIALYRGAKQIEKRQGDVLFTHQGLSGPGILDLSRYILAGDILKLSFIPAKNREDLQAWLLGKTEEGGSRTLRSMLLDQPCSPPLPYRLISRILELSSIPADIRCAHLNRDRRTLLIDNLTGFPLVVERLGGFDQAMVTRGGVSLKEVNPKTMESRKVEGLYLAGEVLDIDGDTGGYNLQAAFSTGMLASRSISKRWLNP